MHVLITGASGFLGHWADAALSAAGHALTRVSRRPSDPHDVSTDLAEPGAFTALLRARAPDAVLHLAAVPDIAPCKADPEHARALNASAVAELARACAHGTRLVHVSTDQVFDGTRGAWSESDEPRPLHVYGETKRAGERAVLDLCPDAAVVRPGLITGHASPGRRSCSSGLRAALEGAASNGERPGLFTDEIRSPIAARDLARALVVVVERAELTGLFHAGGPEALSRFELAQLEARDWGFSSSLIRPSTRAEAGLAGERPADLSLDSTRLITALGWTPQSR
ncbi:MAG: NAD(P)-dependent oxidoreductase [Planctomycetota bacterium]|nr:MAG: NAD(P)-dependent oxidoreductase [Planctomycetota bacterium]